MSKKAGLVAALFVLSSCVTKKPVVVVPNYNIIVEQESALSYDFEKNIGNVVYFHRNSSALNLDARNKLKSQADWLLANPTVTAFIEGHSDISPSRDNTFALASRRAEVVKNYLMSQGVSVSRLRVIAYGKDRIETLRDQSLNINPPAANTVTIIAKSI